MLCKRSPSVRCSMNHPLCPCFFCCSFHRCALQQHPPLPCAAGSPAGPRSAAAPPRCHPPSPLPEQHPASLQQQGSALHCAAVEGGTKLLCSSMTGLHVAQRQGRLTASLQQQGSGLYHAGVRSSSYLCPAAGQGCKLGSHQELRRRGARQTPAPLQQQRVGASRMRQGAALLLRQRAAQVGKRGSWAQQL